MEVLNNNPEMPPDQVIATVMEKMLKHAQASVTPV
jgi:hypothetical protein